ncbi:hypothetical protein Tsubulata_005125 [Turnera subulata]|uniref:MADS-box domain-containing protein n=1 Tax=Turnera subulata TaxID=218843 RepID=A0A9Q0FSI9_9ROSI|nr:hypothetical protein Tsubulata_005125 [Turnera subulata]
MVKDSSSRQVTFSKPRTRLFKKANKVNSFSFSHRKVIKPSFSLPANPSLVFRKK